MISRPNIRVERFMGYSFLTMIRVKSSSPKPRRHKKAGRLATPAFALSGE
jgi:hypothetical protein